MKSCFLAIVFAMIAPLSHGEDTLTDAQLTKSISAFLDVYSKITPGMTRSELLKFFTLAGGLNGPGGAHFAYKKCALIKIDVIFKLKEPDLKVESPEDTIKKVSKPYLEHIVID